MKKQDLEIIIEQLSSMEESFNTVEDNLYQIRKVLEKLK